MARHFVMSAFVLLLGLLSGTVQSAENWSYSVIAQVAPNGNSPIAINDLGQVAYVVREPAGAGLERGAIMLSDGSTTTTLYEATYPERVSVLVVSQIGVNNAGEVVFYGSLPEASGPFRLYRLTGGVPVPIDTAQYLAVKSGSAINNSGQIPFVGGLPNLGAFAGLQMATAERNGTVSGATPVFSPVSPFSAAYGSPAVNDRGDMAISALDVLPGLTRVRLRTFRRETGEATDQVLEVGNGVGFVGVPSLNEARFASTIVATQDGQRRVVMTIPGNLVGLPVGIVEVARTGDEFISLDGDTSISNFNTVAFGGLRRNPQGQQVAFIAVATPGESDPVTVVQTGDVLTPGGGVATLQPFNAGGYLSTNAGNERGQIAFLARINNVSFIMRATPSPGLLPPFPILPPREDILEDRIRFPCLRGPGGGCFAGTVSGGGGRITYWDPPVASGYEYESESATLRFASVVVPAPLARGDSQFTVEVNGESFPLVAGQRFDFLAVAPGGVRLFRITGIDLEEALDPVNPQAFVTGLSFLDTALPSDSFTMRPLVENTDDPDGDGVIASRDNCPAVANPDQADLNGNGVGDVCEILPTISPSVGGVLGNSGWYRSDVAVSWAVSGATTTLGCEPRSVSTDTSELAISCVATNASGSSTSSVTVRRDATIPSISLATPAQGATYPLGATVAAAFNCADVLSGIQQCEGTASANALIDTATPGNRIFRVTSRDVAGNVAFVEHTYSVSAPTDSSPPVIQPVVTGSTGSGGWYVGDVMVSWEVVDAESAIATTAGCEARSITTDTSGLTLTCTASSAGGSATRSITIKRDTVAPYIGVLSPLEITYPRRAWVPALFLCADLRSAIQRCEGSTALGSPLDTKTAGQKTFEVEATDRAGNTSKRVVRYRVR